MPAWVWISLIGATGAVGWYLWKQHQNAQTAATTGTTDTGTGTTGTDTGTDQTQVDFASQIAALQAEIQDLQQGTQGPTPPPPTPQQVTVPDVRNLEVTQAARILEAAGLTVGQSEHEQGKKGWDRIVTAQHPAPQTKVNPGTHESLTWHYVKAKK